MRKTMDPVVAGIRHLVRKYPSFSKVMLFGSRARGDFTEASDYDLAVWAADESGALDFVEELDSLPTLSRFDVVLIKRRHLGTEFYRNIISEGVVLMDKFAIKFGNYQKALKRLHEGIEDASASANLTMRDGAIQRFEFTAELAWKATREYLLQQEVQDINTPKNVMREAWHNHLIDDEAGWLKLLKDRNLTSHVYDEDEADDIFARIQKQHVRLLDRLEETLQEKSEH